MQLVIYLHPPKTAVPGTEDFIIVATPEVMALLDRADRPGNATLVPVKELRWRVHDPAAQAALAGFEEAHVVMVVKRP